MKHLLTMLCFFPGNFLLLPKLSAQQKFLVGTFSWAEGNKAANTGIGETCLYTMPGGSDTMFVCSLSYSTGTAVIKANGRIHVLKQKGKRTSEIFENETYRIWSKWKTNDTSGREEGILYVRNKRTKVLDQVRVVRECSV